MLYNIKFFSKIILKIQNFFSYIKNGKTPPKPLQPWGVLIAGRLASLLYYWYVGTYTIEGR